MEQINGYESIPYLIIGFTWEAWMDWNSSGKRMDDWIFV